MVKLEDKILGKIYRYESEHTLKDVLMRCAVIVFLGGIFSVFSIMLIQAFKEQQTFDIFGVVFEDFDVFKQSAGDILETLSYEVPTLPLVITISSLLALVILALIFLKKFSKIRKRLNAIKRHKLDKHVNN